MPTSDVSRAREGQVTGAGAPEAGTAGQTAETTPDAQPAETPARGRRRWPRRLAAALVIVALVGAADAGLSYALEPYGSISQVVWSAWRGAADEDVDTLFVGSSVAQRSLDPAAVDAVLGTSSFNMATPAQPLADTYTAVEAAVIDHHVSRVILGVDYESFSTKAFSPASISFNEARVEGAPLADKALACARLLTSEPFFGRTTSLGALFPWAYSHVSLSQVKANVERRAGRMDEAQAAAQTNPGWTYYGRGYGNYDGTIDYSCAANLMGTAVYNQQTFRQDNLDALQAICDLCRTNGVELTVVVTPRPAFNVLCYGDAYPRQMALVRDLCRESGAGFYDFNLARKDCYAAADDDFGDAEHLNAQGARRFSGALAQVIKDAAAGQDVSGRFYGYDDWDDYLASIDELSAVKLTWTCARDGLAITAEPYTGTNTQVEYKFLVDWGATGAYEVARDWSGDATLELPTSGHGTVRVEVLARVAGATDAQRTAVKDIDY